MVQEAFCGENALPDNLNGLEAIPSLSYCTRFTFDLSKAYTLACCTFYQNYMLLFIQPS